MSSPTCRASERPLKLPTTPTAPIAIESRNIHLIATPRNEHAVATRATRLLPHRCRHISQIYVPDVPTDDFVSFEHHPQRCRLLPEPVARRVGGKVTRRLVAQIPRHPLPEPVKVVTSVVQRRYHQIRHFHMGFGLGGYRGAQHRLKLATRNRPVKRIRHRLDVDVQGINHLEQITQRLGIDEPIRHQDVLQAGLMHQPPRVPHILEPDSRLVVRIGDADRPIPSGCRRRLLRRELLGRRLPLRDLPVLTELTAEIAPPRPKRQNRRSRMEVIERLLLDRIQCDRGHPGDRKSTRLNSSHIPLSRMPSSA